MAAPGARGDAAGAAQELPRRPASASYLLALAAAGLHPALLRLSSRRAVDDPSDAPTPREFFAGDLPGFILRVVVFLGCVAVFGNLIRREMLDRSLHYYFLTPVRREVLVAAKYLTGAAGRGRALRHARPLISFLLAYAPHTGLRAASSSAARAWRTSGAYLLVTRWPASATARCSSPSASSSRARRSRRSRSSAGRRIHFLLPPLLKKVSVIHYLQSLCPVPFDEGPLAILADAPSPWVADPRPADRVGRTAGAVGVEDPEDGDQLRGGLRAVVGR